MAPRFSIVIATYNRERMLRKTIQSVLDQTYPDWELIVVDDGGSDRTGELVASFGDPRIKYFWKENEERGAARNYGAARSSGDYVNFFDSDDIMYPSHLLQASVHVSANPEAVICFAHHYLDSQYAITGKTTYKTRELNAFILKNNYVHLNDTFIPREELRFTRFVDDRTFIMCEDWHFLVRLAQRRTMVGIDAQTSGYVIHDQGTMQNMSARSFEVALRYFGEIEGLDPGVAKPMKYELYSMLSLALALEGRRLRSLSSFLLAAWCSPFKVLDKRTLGIFKNLMPASNAAFATERNCR